MLNLISLIAAEAAKRHTDVGLHVCSFLIFLITPSPMTAMSSKHPSRFGVICTMDINNNKGLMLYMSAIAALTRYIVWTCCV